ncbi:MAG: toll/interleukin-1 receptor domain-containing protein, partial [Gammaproteobacteria bacterium]|nr:toll/interleukin-1 receptor domain-containing protein [Gammaproteobacteria bacterium]
RRESLGFVGRLHRRLKLAGYDAWFDKVNIPDGEDYTQRISHGIESAHNFIYVMAPRSMTSPYCLIELEYARILGKRIIPVNQAVIFDTPEKALAESDRQAVTAFYQQHKLSGQTIRGARDVLKRSHALIGKTDWLDGKETLTGEDCERLAIWARGYENNWHKHDDPEYLQAFDFPVFGQSIDSLDSVAERIATVTERHKRYVLQHTEILAAALDWESHQKTDRYLLVGGERKQAGTWLLTEFKDGEQPPCAPSDLHCDYICESKKNADNLFTDVFISRAAEDRFWRERINRALSRKAVTVWRHDKDIQSGAPYARAVRQGIEQANAVLFLISPFAVKSAPCLKELDYAAELGKRIIPLLIEAVAELPEILQPLHPIDLGSEETAALNTLLKELQTDNDYYQKYTAFLVQALNWKAQDHNPGILLRGFNLDNAEVWLAQGRKRAHHAPVSLHEKFIQASHTANKGRLHTGIFISYSRKDSGFARKLNTELRTYGKTVWFDQESIAEGEDFQREIYNGIENADNFLFILSPDAVASEFCEAEVRYAAEQNKRFILVRYRAAPPEKIPAYLATLQWIDFKPEDFNVAFRHLIRVLDTDREHVHQHTRRALQAREWMKKNKNRDLLLRGSEFELAQAWLQEAEQEHKQPRPTKQQKNYITASRAAIEAAKRKTKRWIAGLIGSLVVTLAALAAAGWLYMEALVQRDEAEHQ